MPAHWRFVLAPSVVRSAKTGGAQGAYNNLARGAQALLESGTRAHAARAFARRGARAGGARTAARRSCAARRSTAGPPDVLDRRLEHFIREDAPRRATRLAAFRAADAPRWPRSPTPRRPTPSALLGNQVPETIALARAARAHGAFAACSFGAGFGGSVWALVAATPRRSPRAGTPRAFVARPGPPLTDAVGRPRAALSGREAATLANLFRAPPVQACGQS